VIERQLEAFGGRERIDLVTDRVAVRKLNRRPHRDDDEIRREREVYLIEDGVDGRDVRMRGPLDRHNGADKGFRIGLGGLQRDRPGHGGWRSRAEHQEPGR
jgi:hypothetical protein